LRHPVVSNQHLAAATVGPSSIGTVPRGGWSAHPSKTSALENGSMRQSVCATGGRPLPGLGRRVVVRVDAAARDQDAH
jgi:hypothetical protein